MDIVFLQSCDAFHYRPMLEATSRTVVEFCRRSSCRYESFVGIKRGFWPWQATYNRIFQFRELVERGFEGWAIYLDADAYVVGLDFDLRAYLADKSDCTAVMTPSMATAHGWDINSGVLLLNLAHPGGRHLLDAWQHAFAGLTDEQLRDAREWDDVPHDQSLLQGLLHTDPGLLDQVFLQSTDLMNSRYASFIRQHLRTDTPTLDARIARIRLAVDQVLGRHADSRDAPVPDPIGAEVENGIVSALYQGLLGREPDAVGGRNAAATLHLLGLSAGVRALASEIIASAEFGNRRRAG